MENFMQTGMKRNQYFEGTIPDIRNIFVNFGHYLEKKGIKDEGDIFDYENYLIELDKQKEQQREDEHLEMISWILEQQNWENSFMLIRGSEWDRFYNSDDEDDIIDMQIIECYDFYTKFKEITGVDLIKLDDFVKMSYIDGARNDIEIVIKADTDGKNKRFIIGV
jgi:hypothetical protein